jgi:hypothetical protein
MKTAKAVAAISFFTICPPGKMFSRSKVRRHDSAKDQKDATGRLCCGASLSTSLLISAVALSRGHTVLRVMPHVLSKRASDVHNFVELTFLIPSYVPLIFSGIDQLSLAFFCFRHG